MGTAASASSVATITTGSVRSANVSDAHTSALLPNVGLGRLAVNRPWKNGTVAIATSPSTTPAMSMALPAVSSPQPASRRRPAPLLRRSGVVSQTVSAPPTVSSRFALSDQ